MLFRHQCRFPWNETLLWPNVLTQFRDVTPPPSWATATSATAVNRVGSAAPTHFPLNCPNIYSFYSGSGGVSNKQGCGFVSEAKARIGGSVSAPRCQARSGAGRMLVAQCGHSHRTQYSKTWGMIRNITVQWNTWNMDREVFIICPSVAYKVFTFMFVWGWLCQLKYVHYIVIVSNGYFSFRGGNEVAFCHNLGTSCLCRNFLLDHDKTNPDILHTPSLQRDFMKADKYWTLLLFVEVETYKKWQNISSFMLAATNVHCLLIYPWAMWHPHICLIQKHNR